MNQIDTSSLDNIIVGRVTPHIYAFATNTVPNYIKVGDTYRPVPTRLNEWKKVFADLQEIFRDKAIVHDDIYFRDYAVHKFLIDIGKARHSDHKLSEFFDGATSDDVESAIEDIKTAFDSNINKYDYYRLGSGRVSQTHEYKRSEISFELRPLQKIAVDNFIKRYSDQLNGQDRHKQINLLLYAVMRFGKSFVSLMCAKAMREVEYVSGLGKRGQLVVVVSAKADIKDEWKKNTQEPANFLDFVFVDNDLLARDENIIKTTVQANKTAVVFLTLQDLQGEKLKHKHKEIFENKIDLLIVDETHFGARAASLGLVLNVVNKDSTEKEKQQSKELAQLIKDEIDDIKSNIEEDTQFEEGIKLLNARVKLHLSGTPYRILMSDEFKKEDIICFIQHSDIHKAKEEWDNGHLENDKSNEWDNPYYGTPQMVRFAFNLNEESRKMLETLAKDSDIQSKLSKLFDTTKSKNASFVYEKQVLELLQSIDGSKTDNNIFSFLNYDKIKQGNMARHMVFVLPSRVACDAIENLINEQNNTFANLQNYTLLNISGKNTIKNLSTVEQVKSKIKQLEADGQMSITLTVNKMLTGVTVEEWDTMVFLRGTSSPQSYDQVIFRIMSPYVVEYTSSNDNKIKLCKKPQVLLVDFDPNRMFRLFHERTLLYGIKGKESGVDILKSRLDEEIKISPIITLDSNNIKEVEATDIVQAVREYSINRSIADEAQDVPFDINFLKLDSLKKIIENENELGGKNGFSIFAVTKTGQIGVDFDSLVQQAREEKENQEEQARKEKESGKALYQSTDAEQAEMKSMQKKFASQMARILFFAYLTKSQVKSLQDIGNLIREIVYKSPDKKARQQAIDTGDVINNIDINNNEDIRIFRNLNLSLENMAYMIGGMSYASRLKLDHKIENINELSNDNSLTQEERIKVALKRFGRLSASEISTPANIAKEMFDTITDNEIYSLFGMIKSGDMPTRYAHILDIASKMGEFGIAIHNRLTSLKIPNEFIAKSIYALPTSSIAYEFTRKIFEALEINTNNIAMQDGSGNGLNSYDLLKCKTVEYNRDGTIKLNSNNEPIYGKVDFKLASKLLTQNKDFSTISIKDIDFITMQPTSTFVKDQKVFDIIIGNPPYQENISETHGNSSLGKQLFPTFVMFAHELKSEFTCLITPSRWFTGDAQDGSFVRLREYIKKNNRIVKITHHNDASEVFDNVVVKGGVNYFLSKKQGKDLVEFRTLQNGVISSSNRKLFEDGLDIILADADTYSVIQKVCNKDFESLTTISQGRDAFGFVGREDIVELQSKDKHFEGSVELRIKSNKIRYTEEKNIIRNIDILNSYKIFVSKSAGDPAKDQKVIGRAYIGKPKSACTDSLIPIGKFKTLFEAESLQKYMSTKFLRYLVSVLKVSQNVSQNVYQNVPLQDFTPNSNIDWTMSISDIDKQLYAKYDLTQDQINFIEMNIRAMV